MVLRTPNLTHHWGADPAGQTANGQGRCTCCNSSQSLGPAAPQGGLQPPGASHSHGSSSPIGVESSGDQGSRLPPICDKRPPKAISHSEKKREVLVEASSLSIDGEAIVPRASCHHCLRRLNKLGLGNQDEVSSMGLNMPTKEGLLTQMEKE